MMLPLLAVLPVSAATPTDGFTFDGDEWYYANGTLSDVPRTVEAWIYVDPNYATQARTTIISNYNGFTNYAYWHLALHYTTDTGLYPYFEWNELYNNTTSQQTIRKFNFTNAKITAGEWTHIAVVIDAANNYVSCYKNGTHIQNNNGSFQLSDIAKNTVELPFSIGNDSRPSATGTEADRAFHGKIASISLFDDVRTASEISSDYSNGAATDDANALAHWDFTSNAESVTDKVGNIDLTLSKYWLTEDEMKAIRGDSFDPEYSFAVVGDIQYITEYDVNNGTSFVEEMHEWIADNVSDKNIKYVMNMGDITNQDTDAEWKLAYDSVSGALNEVVDYSMIRGNHDLYLGGTGLDTYWGTDDVYTAQFRSDRGGMYVDGSVINTYTKFTVGSTSWLVINLDFAANDGVLDWANQVVAAHPDHKVIMTTHGYLHMDGTPISDEDSGSLWGDTKNNGEEMWTKFASLHENIVLILSGHMESNNIMMSQAKGVHGNTVTQFLIDQQAVDKAYMTAEAKPLGLVAMFYFDKDGKNVSVEWYSPLRNKYFQTRNQLSFDMTAACEEQKIEWSGVSITPKGAGTISDPYVVENGGNLLWMSQQCSTVKDNEPYFDGVYFKQICDIDLGGNIVKSIGYYHTTEAGALKMAAFGGYYDGGGYSIKNGRISAYNISHKQDINWSDGLFGAIYGATIKNVVLENIDIYSKGVTGAIVGRAIAPFDGSATADFNIISGCEVKSTCNIYAYHCLGQSVNDETVYGNEHNAGIVGSICGMAYATTIKGCTSAAEFSLDGNHSIAGGIVGAAGYNSVIDACSFTGGMTVAEASSKVASSFGGIVGAVIPCSTSETMWVSDVTTGSLSISNCYNSGYFLYSASTAPSKELHWGGIVGNASELYDIDNAMTISKCYNLYGKQAESTLTSNCWIGGIVGKAGATEGADVGTLVITDSTSVTVDAKGGTGTNEYRYTNTKTSDNKLPAEADNMVTTLSANDMSNKVSEIDKLISSIRPFKLVDIQDNTNQGGNNSQGGESNTPGDGNNSNIGNNGSDNNDSNVGNDEVTDTSAQTTATSTSDATQAPANTVVVIVIVVAAASVLLCALVLGTVILLAKKKS